VPLTAQGELRIRFRNDRPLPLVAGRRILESRAPDPVLRSLFSERIALVGGVEPVFEDTLAVPFNRLDVSRPRMPGVMILGQMIENVLAGNGLAELPASARTVALVLIALACAGAFAPVGRIGAALLCALAAAALFAGAIHLFVTGLFVPLVDLLAVPFLVLAARGLIGGPVTR
jgi:CHASE2 domain-containing sensor protein